MLLAETVEPRHAQGVVSHDVDGVHPLVQQGLPALVKGVDGQGPGGQIEHPDIRLQVLGLGGGEGGVGVNGKGAAAQGRKGPGQAHLLPVVGALSAGRAAVELRDGNGQHESLLNGVTRQKRAKSTGNRAGKSQNQCSDAGLPVPSPDGAGLSPAAAAAALAAGCLGRRVR